MKNQYRFQVWHEPNFRAVNRFYRSQKHKGSASGDEHVFVIYQLADTSESTPDEHPAEDTLVAAVRLVPNDGFFWLRGLYVEKSLRGQNLGSELLTFVHSHYEQQPPTPALPIYCFPYTHLNDFYRKSGYQDIEAEQLPEKLEQLYTRYSGKGESIINMVKTFQ